jgi:hypothetical protein
MNWTQVVRNGLQIRAMTERYRSKRINCELATDDAVSVVGGTAGSATVTVVVAHALDSPSLAVSSST